ESGLGAGTQAISAKYAGSTEFASSVSLALEQQVTVQGSTTLLIPTVDPAPYGETLLFVVSVVPDGGTGVPTGPVALMSDGCAVGTATLSGGTAAVVVSSLDAGGHALTADYPGDANFSASASGAVTQTIDAADADGLPHHGDHRPAGHPHRRGDLGLGAADRSGDLLGRRYQHRHGEREWRGGPARRPLSPLAEGGA